MIKLDTKTGLMEATGSVIDITADVVCLINNLFSMMKQTGDEFGADFFKYAIRRSVEDDKMVWKGEPVPGAVCASFLRGDRK